MNNLDNFYCHFRNKIISYTPKSKCYEVQLFQTCEQVKVTQGQNVTRSFLCRRCKKGRRFSSIFYSTVSKSIPEECNTERMKSEAIRKLQAFTNSIFISNV